MARVTEGQVREIVDTKRDLESFIETANVLVTTHVKPKVSDEDLLTRIELYLAAHFTAVTEERGGLVESSVDDATERMANVYEGGLRATRYGQQAIVLDHSGALASITTNKLRAQFRVV